jgi:hypothetical protein
MVQASIGTSSSFPPDAQWVRPLPSPEDVTPVTHVRGTLLAASREQLRAAGHFARYESFLPPQSRPELDAALAGTWLPIDLAHDHYAAVDHLGLTEPEIREMTEEVSRKLSGAFMQTMSSTLRTSGLTPWDVVPFYDKVWRRLFVGGAFGIAKVGPKDARFVIVGHPLVKHRYHRIGLSRHLVIGVQFLVAKRAYVRELRLDVSAGRSDFLLQWV